MPAPLLPLLLPVLSLGAALAVRQPPDSTRAAVAPPAPAAGAPDAPRGVAARVRRAPSVDGRLDDAAWQDAPPVTAFWQSNPVQGAPASRPTEVRVLYDDAALYVGARLRDGGPAERRAVLTRRDGSSPSDELSVALDTYHDHQTAAVFTVNPLGVRSDRLTGNDQAFGDDSWDPVWQAAVRQDADGWTVEMRIPLSQLRFPPRDEQTWGINVFRGVTARNETDALVLVRQNEPGFASRFAHLVGVRGVPQPKRVELLPYVRTQVDARRAAPGDPFFDGRDASQAAGVDVKYGVTSNLTLDATVNPDFGQVEADPAQLNLTVFEQFFQERRPFFVEGAPIFAFGGGGFGDAGSLFYSRRIGRAPTLSPDLAPALAEAAGAARAGEALAGPFTDVPRSTPILGAAKLSGKLAHGTSLGLLQAETGRVFGRVAAGLGGPASGATAVRYRDELEPRARYSVARVKQDFRSGRTSVGAIYTRVGRDLDTPRLDSLFRREADAVGVDWQHRWSQNRLGLTGNAVWSRVAGSRTAITAAQRSSARYYQRPDQDYLHLDPAATAMEGGTATTSLVYSGRSGLGWRLQGGITTPGYELNDLGFLTRADARTALARVSWNSPRPTRHFRQLATEAVTTLGWNNGGENTGRTANLNVVAVLQSNWFLFTSVARGFGGITAVPTRGGPSIRSTPNRSVFASVSSDARRALSGGTTFSRFLSESGTNMRSLGASLTWRPSATVSLGAGPGFSRTREMGYLVARVPDTLAARTFGARYVFGALTQTTLSATVRANVTFTPSLSFQLYGEPFTSGASAADFRELRTPGAFDFAYYRDDPNARVERLPSGDWRVTLSRDGRVVRTFAIGNQDARYRSLRGSAVLRWEYRPGATLFAVWQHSRSDYETGARYGGAGDLRSLLGLPPENVLLLKVNYWLSR